MLWVFGCGNPAESQSKTEKGLPAESPPSGKDSVEYYYSGVTNFFELDEETGFQEKTLYAQRNFPPAVGFTFIFSSFNSANDFIARSNARDIPDLGIFEGDRIASHEFDLEGIFIASGKDTSEFLPKAREASRQLSQFINYYEINDPALICAFYAYSPYSWDHFYQRFDYIARNFSEEVAAALAASKEENFEWLQNNEFQYAVRRLWKDKWRNYHDLEGPFDQ